MARKIGDVKAIDATLALAENGMKMLAAKRAVEELIDTGETAVDVPLANAKLSPRLARAGIELHRVASDVPNIKAIREALGLTQERFAVRYNLNLRSIQNWEQGREPDEAVQSYLRVIARFPEQAAEAQEGEW